MSDPFRFTQRRTQTYKKFLSVHREGIIRARADNAKLNVVAAYNAVDDETIVVTVYEPDPAGWSPDFRRKAR